MTVARFSPAAGRRLAISVAREAGVSPDVLFSQKRGYLNRIALVRQVAYRRLHTDLGMSLCAIARMFDTDHSTVLFGIRAVDARDARLGIGAFADPHRKVALPESAL